MTPVPPIITYRTTHAPRPSKAWMAVFNHGGRYLMHFFGATEDIASERAIEWWDQEQRVEQAKKDRLVKAREAKKQKGTK